jgi:hypothetical protein
MFNLPCVPGIPLIRSSHIWYCALRMFYQFLWDKVHMPLLIWNWQESVQSYVYPREFRWSAPLLKACLRPLLCWKFHHIFELVLPGAAVASLEEDLMSLILPLLVALNDVVSLLKSCLLATSFKKPPGYENPVLLANETACESPYISLTKLCSCLVRSIILIHSGMNTKVRMSCSSGREVLSAMAESWQPSFGFP